MTEQDYKDLCEDLRHVKGFEDATLSSVWYSGIPPVITAIDRLKASEVGNKYGLHIGLGLNGTREDCNRYVSSAINALRGNYAIEPLSEERMDKERAKCSGIGASPLDYGYRIFYRQAPEPNGFSFVFEDIGDWIHLETDPRRPIEECYMLRDMLIMLDLIDKVLNSVLDEAGVKAERKLEVRRSYSGLCSLERYCLEKPAGEKKLPKKESGRKVGGWFRLPKFR